MLAGMALFAVYLRLSRTVPENSDQANILLAASDMLHGNLVLHGWYLTDVSFYTTELPQYALLEIFFGLHADTAHIAAAMTYTLAVLLAVLLARGGISDRQAVARMLITAGIMLAPQLGVGISSLILSVGHIGTAIPVLLVWLILDRAPQARPRGWVPVAVALGLAWVLIADRLVLIIGVAPLALVCGIRVIEGVVRARSVSRGLRERWYELSLIAAAGAATGMAWAAERLIGALGGYVLNPVPFTFAFHDFVQNLHSLWAVPQVFGADYRGLTGMPFAIAVLHMVSVVLVCLAVLLVACRFFSGVTLVDQVLAVAVVLNVALFVVTSAGAEGPHEIAVVAPFGAALAGRMLAGRARQPAADPRAAGTPAAGNSTAGNSTAGTRPGGLLGRRARAAGYVTGGLVLAGYLVGLAHEVAQPASSPDFSRVASWLEAHNLRYGLGGYWESSIVTVQTGGRVTVRALVKNTLGPDLWLAKPSWYDPVPQRATFIVLSSTPGFVSSWEPRALIRKYFGRPAQEYNFGPYTVMVWDRNLLPSVPPPAGAAHLADPSVPG